MVMPAQGQIWWVETPHAKGRPYLIMTRDAAIPVLNTLLAAPLTTTIRGIPTELPLTAAEGVRRECVASLDNVVSIPRSMLRRPVGQLAAGRWHEVCEAVRHAIGC